MQTRHRKKMKRPSLLKRFFDVFRCLMPQTERNAAEKILDLWRIIQSPTNHAPHPSPRFLRGSKDWISGAAFQQAAHFRISHKQTSPHILAREIRTHVELAGIPRWRDWLGNSKKFQFIAELWIPPPAHEQRRLRWPAPPFKLDRFELEQKSRESVRRHF